MYNEIIAALEEAANDESAITVFTGKNTQKGSNISESLALQRWMKKSGQPMSPWLLPCQYLLTCHAVDVVPSSETFPGCFRPEAVLKLSALKASVFVCRGR